MSNSETPNEYHYGKIYKVVNSDSSDCWIGSTVQPLGIQMDKHKDTYIRMASYLPGWKIHRFFDKHGLSGCKIVLLEKYPCKSLDELKRREKHYINKTECINKMNFGCGAPKYSEEERNKIKEKMEKYQKEYEQDKQRLQKNARERERYYKKRDEILANQKLQREKTKKPYWDHWVI
jgi:hypothetical protein